MIRPEFHPDDRRFPSFLRSGRTDIFPRRAPVQEPLDPATENDLAVPRAHLAALRQLWLEVLLTFLMLAAIAAL